MRPAGQRSREVLKTPKSKNPPLAGYVTSRVSHIFMMKDADGLKPIRTKGYLLRTVGVMMLGAKRAVLAPPDLLIIRD